MVALMPVVVVGTITIPPKPVRFRVGLGEVGRVDWGPLELRILALVVGRPGPEMDISAARAVLVFVFLPFLCIVFLHRLVIFATTRLIVVVLLSIGYCRLVIVQYYGLVSNIIVLKNHNFIWTLV
jgi:hypothetical protein